MTRFEQRITFSLASIYGLRMLGLFLVLPVFALYAQELTGSAPFLIGVTVGIYGLTSAFLQVPFGMLSDRWGRKEVVLLGISLFIVGSFIAAYSTSIWGVMLGRALQGSGAISGTLLALVSDLTTTEMRTRVMAIVGFSIAASFALAMILGPFLNSWIGCDGLFALCAGLGVIAFLMVSFWVPRPEIKHAVQLQSTEQLRSFTWLYTGVFILHFLITAIFLAVPFELVKVVGNNTSWHSLVYLIVLVLSFLISFLVIKRGEHQYRTQTAIQWAISGLAVGALWLWLFSNTLIVIGIGLLIFFVGFNFLEATLPALLSKQVPLQQKGKIFGIYSTHQFLGTFAGGLVSGWVAEHWGFETILVVSALVAGLWYLLTFRMNPTIFERGQVTWQEESTKLS